MGAATRRQDALDTTLAHCVRIKSLLSTSDGKDKVMSLMQYACMTVSGGADGDALRAQKSIASARKPFRVFKVRVTFGECAVTRTRRRVVVGCTTLTRTGDGWKDCARSAPLARVRRRYRRMRVPE